MRVILAQPRGFCAGVVRAIEIVERALQTFGPPVYVRHEIVHNRHVVESLKAKGARFVEELSEVPPQAVTIFSAHGVARAVEEEAAAARPATSSTPPARWSARSITRPTATSATPASSSSSAMPGIRRSRAPRAAFRCRCIWCRPRRTSPSSISRATPRIAYVTQTTLSVDDTRGIIAALERKFSDVVGPDTRDICYATQNRQSAVRELCKLADVLLVVGASNSSNSNRLREIGADFGIPSYLIADGSELRPEWVEGAKTVGHHRRRLGARDFGRKRHRRACATRRRLISQPWPDGSRTSSSSFPLPWRIRSRPSWRPPSACRSSAELLYRERKGAPERLAAASATAHVLGICNGHSAAATGLRRRLCRAPAS